MATNVGSTQQRPIHKLPKRRAKAAIKRAIMPYREATAPLRMMPDFIIIGAQKAGTTSLYMYLTKHPHVKRAFGKEVHFFDRKYSKGMGWYRSYFPYSFLNQFTSHRVITGESSPGYMFNERVPQRIAKELPQVKLIALLRNPVDRAYSQYNHQIRYGQEHLSFEDAIDLEMSRLSGDDSMANANSAHNGTRYGHGYTYLSRGIYVSQLKRWADVFPKDRILVLNSERFFSDAAAHLGKVQEFLELPQYEHESYKAYNNFSYSPMSNTARQRLQEFFCPYNEELFGFLGETFDWER